MFNIGDRVKYVKAPAGKPFKPVMVNPGEIGTVISLDTGKYDYPYKVQFERGEGRTIIEVLNECELVFEDPTQLRLFI